MENNSCVFGGEDERMDLPPGFRFHPTDEELISHYLFPKVLDSNFYAAAIGEVDFTKCEPWDLPKRAKMGENEWYFFCLKDRKYPTGLRTNRATEAGYWKATGKDKEIYKGKPLVGMKKTLVFYKGRAPKGVKSNWVMHEYRLDGKFSPQNLPTSARNEWVICRTFHKNSSGKKVPYCPSVLPPLTDSSPSFRHVSCFSSPMAIPQQTPFPGNADCFSQGFCEALNPVYPQYPDGIFHENHVLRSMMEENGAGGRMKTERVTVSASHDTSLSSEMNPAEICSVVSNYEMGLRGPLDGHHEGEGPSTLAGPPNTGSYWSWNYL